MNFGPAPTHPLVISTEQEAEVKKAICTGFSALQHGPREEGTCKKMVRLNSLRDNWSELAVVFGHRADAKHAQIIHDERKFLAHLERQSYPVVQVFGEEFVVEHDALGNERFGMLMRYIPGIFIEAKTPAPLKIYIIAALLGIQYIKPQEAWLALHKDSLLEDISLKSQNSDDFAELKIRAKTLENNFDTLIEKFEQQHEMVVDLQMIISPDGTLTLIDPLDVLVQNKSKYQSILPEAPAPNDDLKKFLSNTRGWLRTAKDVCCRISSASHYADLSSLLNFEVDPMMFSSRSDPKGNSRISKLKAQNSTRPSKFKFGL